ncbi:MAG: PAS domain S-box protein, partial [Chloroflexi bacterium]|nr:PAS domain S-box protein [Chloroflexota bacterium]
MPPSYVGLNQKIALLLIEDNPADSRLIQELLPELHLKTAARLADGFELLARQQPDVILLDLYLPDSEGIETLHRVRSSAPQAAIVVITRFEEESVGLEAIHAGAQDYLVKGQIDTRILQRSIQYALERQQWAATLRNSEEQFRLMFEQSAVGMAYVDLGGQFRYVNKTLCEFLGYDRPDLLQKTFADVTYADDLAEDWANVHRLLAGDKRDYTMEKRYVHQNGSVIWADLTVTLVRTERGNPKYLLAVVQDITDRKEAEAVKSHLAAIVESSQDGIIGKDLDGTILSWNAAAERIYGWSADEAIGQSIALLYPSGRDEEFDRILATIRRGEPISRIETRRVRKDGEQLDIALTISPLKNADGQVIGASTIERDITALKLAQAAREESEQRLRQLTDNINEVLWLRDVATDQMLYVNPAFSTVWEVPREHLYNQPFNFIESVHPTDREQVLAAREQYATGGFDEEYRIVLADGQVRWIRARTFPIQNKAGETYRVAGIAEDITEYKRLMLAEQEHRALAEALRDTANALNSTVDMGEILDRLLTNIEHVVPHDAAEVLLIDGDEASIVRSRGYAQRGLQPALDTLRFPVAEMPNLRYMHQTNNPLIIVD